MPRNYHWLLLLVVMVTVCFHGTKATCAVADFRTCLAKVPFDLKIPTENLTREDFEQGCGNITAFSDCVTGLQCTSDNEQLYPHYLKYLDTAEGYAYLCRPDTQTAFFANTECLQAGFTAHTGLCANTVSPIAGDDDRCRYIHDRAECAFDQTMEACRDERVARLVKTVIIKAHKRQYEATHGCVISEIKATCTAENFRTCRAKVPFDLTIPTENLTRSDFRQGCRNVEAFSDCVTRLQCTSDDKQLYPHYLMYLDTADKYAYLCQPDTQTAFFANAECLQTGFMYHNDECADSVDRISSDRDSCRYLYERAECAFNWTLASCHDERVAQLIKTAIIKEQKKQYEGTYRCVVGQCRQLVLESCLVDVGLELNITIDGKIDSYDSDQKFDAACSALNALRGCVVSSRCEGNLHNGLDRFLDTMDSLCLNDSRQVFMDGKRCFANESTQANLMKQCGNTDNRIDSADQCTVREQLKTCRRTVYTNNCGKRATDLILGALEKLEDNPCAATGKSTKFTANRGVKVTSLCSGVIASIVFLSTLLLNLARLATGAIW